jgi:L-amino acid N-acyltransferase YncA
MQRAATTLSDGSDVGRASSTNKLIFRRCASHGDGKLSAGDSIRLKHLVSPFQAILRLRPLVKALGWRAWVKAVAKLATPSRSMYIVCDSGKCVSFGWIMRGFCRAYHIDSQDYVVGPIYTSPEHRGRGLATIGLRFAVQEMSGRGWKWCYIDTASENLASQRAILRAGFDGPVGLVTVGLGRSMERDVA